MFSLSSLFLCVCVIQVAHMRDKLTTLYLLLILAWFTQHKFSNTSDVIGKAPKLKTFENEF